MDIFSQSRAAHIAFEISKQLTTAAAFAGKYDSAFSSDVEFHENAARCEFERLAAQLGFKVTPITALDTARLADDVAAMAPVRALEAAE